MGRNTIVQELRGLEMDEITIAILARNKAKYLPLYLTCLQWQTFPKSNTHLYIRSNDNVDDTTKILKQWTKQNKKYYASVAEDYTDLGLERVLEHEWERIDRFTTLCKIRQDSIKYAENIGTHYFVADCDNFIIPETIETLVNTNKDIIGPLLKTLIPGSLYSNYHYNIDVNGYSDDGYNQSSTEYIKIFNMEKRGLHEVRVVHCTYLVRNYVLDKMNYIDGSGRFDYVVFSSEARKHNIKQYIDNRKFYGLLALHDEYDEEKFRNEMTKL